MAANTILSVGAGGDTIRTIDRATSKTQVIVLDIGGDAGPESLVTSANPLIVGLPSGASTGAKQDTGNTSLANLDTKTPALGQALAAASSPVVLTAAQLSTLTPPAAITGFALEAGHLATIDTKIPALGQALAAASVPVVLTASQLTTLTPLSTVAIGAGAAVIGHVIVDSGTITTVSTVTAVSAVNTVIPGTGATNQGKAEDAAHTTGDTGVMALGVRNDLEANQTSADLDYGAPALDVAGRVRTREISNLIATTISGANAGVTLTLAAAGAGLFHYITSVEIINVNPTAAAIAGSAVTLSYTSTNIPGSPAWTAGNALAAGAEKVVERIVFSGAVKTTTANTATTFVAPAIGAGGLCRMIVTYYIAP